MHADLQQHTGRLPALKNLSCRRADRANIGSRPKLLRPVMLVPRMMIDDFHHPFEHHQRVEMVIVRDIDQDKLIVQRRLAIVKSSSPAEHGVRNAGVGLCAAHGAGGNASQIEQFCISDAAGVGVDVQIGRAGGDDFHGPAKSHIFMTLW
ncbi:hypothetical protein D3C72_1823260 [compost metagenome]